MYKQLFTYIFVFVLSISIVFGNSIETMNPEDVINSAFIESKAKLESVNINSYVVLEDEFLTIDNSSKICNDISEKLIVKEASITRESDEGFSQISLQGIIDQGINVTIILQSSRLKDFKESSIVIDIVGTREEYDISQLCDKIREILGTYGDVRLNINLVGYYDGAISNKELIKKINKVFKKIGAKKIEGIEGSELISITGYTSKTKENISYCGKKVNINIAARFNSYENKTYILIGTPLIVIEY